MTIATATPQQAQQRFRVLLQALSRPGCPVQLAGADAALAPLALVRYPLVIAETLLDHEVGFAVIGDGLGLADAQLLAREVRLRTGAQPVTAAEAHFVFVFGRASDALRELCVGDPAFPDRGATLIWAVAGFDDEVDGTSRTDGGRALLSGPGIPNELRLFLGDVAPDDLAALAEINANYPCGLDVLFVDAAGNVVGLPRSTRLEFVTGEGAEPTAGR